MKPVLLTLPDGCGALCCCMCCCGGSPQGSAAEMNNYHPSASICVSDPTLAFRVFRASRPRSTATAFAPPPTPPGSQLPPNSAENDIHLPEEDVLSGGLNITVIVFLISWHNRKGIKGEAGGGGGGGRGSGSSRLRGFQKGEQICGDTSALRC